MFAEPPLLPGQSFLIPTGITQNSLTARVDHSATDEDRLSCRVSLWDYQTPNGLSSRDHPSNAVRNNTDSLNVLGTWTRFWNTDRLSELKVGYNGFEWTNLLAPPEDGVCSQEFSSTTDQLTCQPNYVFPGLTIGGPANFPQKLTQDLFSARFQLYWNRGPHDMKIGGELLGWRDGGEWHLGERGQFIFNTSPPT